VQAPIGKNLASSSSGTRKKNIYICFEQGCAARENIAKACGCSEFNHQDKMLQNNLSYCV
jgi:hypothetical protein